MDSGKQPTIDSLLVGGIRILMQLVNQTLDKYVTFLFIGWAVFIITCAERYELRFLYVLMYASLAMAFCYITDKIINWYWIRQYNNQKEEIEMIRLESK